VRVSKAIFILPHLFTVASIFCGMVAIFLAVRGAFYQAGMAVFIAMILDAFDGRVARMTNTQSDFGVQIDSLADLVSFGVAPAVLVYLWALIPFGFLGMAVAFVYVSCGALRLARFNVMAAEKGPTNFVGLPIPLAACGLISLIMLHCNTEDQALAKEPLIFGVVLLLAILMVSNVPYRSFKKVTRGWAWAALAALATTVATAIVLASFALAFVVVVAFLIAAGLAEGSFVFVTRKRSAIKSRQR
jgi:CDP-diacylglycerol--serine O-phosphatidyltransferase